MKIYYLSNMGVLIESNTKKILVDTFISEALPFRPLYASTEDKLLKGTFPYNNIDLIAITHVHLDHFNSQKVAAFLHCYPDTPVVAPRAVIDELRPLAPKQTLLHAIVPPLMQSQEVHIAGIHLSAINLPHIGRRFVDIVNLSFLFHLEQTVLHTGDTAHNMETSIALAKHASPCDVFLAAFPFLMQLHALERVKQYIDPKEFLVLHLPQANHDRLRWLDAAQKTLPRSVAYGLSVHLATKEEQIWTFCENRPF